MRQGENSVISVLSGNRREKPITLGSKQVTEEVLSAEEFLFLANKNPGIIKSSRALMPESGENGFGAFLVCYTYPKYHAA
jgi:hypothetical protein